METSSSSSLSIYQNSFFMSELDKNDAQKLFIFLGIVNNLINQGPKGLKKLNKIEKLWQRQLSGSRIDHHTRQAVVDLKDLASKYEFDEALISNYIIAKKRDFSDKQFENFDDLEKYMEGAAESIGLIVARILGLKHDSDEYVRYQSDAIMYLGFIRSLAEDSEAGRFYFPKSEIRRFGLPYPNLKNASKYPGAYREFIEAQTRKYNVLQLQAQKGLKFLTYSKRITLHTIIDLNNWEAKRIYSNPLLVFNGNTKPSRAVVIKSFLIRMIHA